MSAIRAKVIIIFQCAATVTSLLGLYMLLCSLFGATPHLLNTGMGFLLGGLGVLSIKNKPVIACLLGIVVALMGAMTLLAIVLQPYTELTALFLNRMDCGPNTALAFMLLGLFIILHATLRPSEHTAFSQLLLSITLLIIALLALMGYLIQLPIGYTWDDNHPMSLLTAMGFFCISLSTLYANSEMIERTQIKMQYVMPILIFIIGSLLFFMTWQALKEEAHNNIKKSMAQTASNVSSNIKKNISNRIKNLSIIAHSWTKKNGLTEKKWREDASFIMDNIQGFQAIEWIDSSNHIKWIQPLKGNEKAKGFNIAFEKNRRAALDLAKNSRQATLSNPVDLVQGGKGLLAFVPLFKHNEFNGFILGIFKTKELFNAILPHDILSNYQIVIKIHQDTVFDTLKNDTPRYWQYHTTFSLKNSHWVLSVHPLPHQIETYSTYLPILSLLLGILFTIALSFACYFLLIFRRNEKNTLAQKKRLKFIYDISTHASYENSYEALTQQCITLICQTLNWPIGHAYHLNPDKNLLEPMDIWHIEYADRTKLFKQLTDNTTFKLGIGLPGRVWETKRPAWIEDVYKDSNFTRANSSNNLGVHSAIGVPVLINNQVTAVFEFFNHETIIEDTDFIKTLEVISEQLSSVFEKKSNEEKLETLAHIDPITQLSNRGFFIELLEHALSKAKITQSKLALLHIDLDGFKRHNDAFGHEFGDKILKHTADQLKSIIHESDFIARIGADEFIILLEDLTDHKAAETLSKQIIKAFNKRLDIDGTEIIVTVSIGIVTYPLSGDSVSTLIQHADMALNSAKSDGKNKYRHYSDALNKENKRQYNIEKQLQNALANDEFHMVYQPQIESATGKLLGFESLIRWENPELGSISPMKFIPIAEEAGLIRNIGEWTLTTACQQFLSWEKSLGRPLAITMSINASALQLAEEYTDTMINTIIETTLNPKNIVIEITETTLMSNIDSATHALNKLHQLGVAIAIDDFGTGYSSLNYLKTLPINTLKIDKSFVCDITLNTNDASIVLAMIQLARALDLHVVAEGVETQSQFDCLKQQGCDCIQGYYFSNPLSANDALTFIKNHSSP